MVSETNVATAALAIAIAALVIAAGQLIAQLFSTADGYRRCQPSVIGAWYKLVELKFRWSSFRYEVKVTTPHFGVGPMEIYERRDSFLLDQGKPLPEFPWSLFMRKSQYLVPVHFQASLLGTPGSRLGTFCPDVMQDIVFYRKAGKTGWRAEKAIDGMGEDVPTWLTLLDDIHRDQFHNFGRFVTDTPLKDRKDDIAPIYIIRKTRSWDFMPPDIVRPVSSTTLGCLITMAYRLGMTWSDFRLDEGKMRASGSGRSFSTSTVRGMGLVVEYSGNISYDYWSGVSRMFSVAADKVDRQANGAEASNTMSDWSQRATSLCPIVTLAYKYKMTCGIIHAGERQRWTVGNPDLRLRNSQWPPGLELKQPFSVLEMSDDAKVALEASLSHRDPAHRLPAFTDVMGLWCDWIPLRNLQTNRIDNPFPFPLTTMGERPESRNVWRSELRKQESSLSDARKLVLRFYDDWELQNSKEFVNEYRLQGTSNPQIAFFKKAFDDTTAYLDEYLKAVKADCYYNTYKLLIRVHISINARSVEQAEENVKNNVARGTDSLPDNLDPIFQERAYIYAENVPKFVDEMENTKVRDLDTNISYEDVWWMMMMRLHAWTMSVNWVDDKGGVKIPSEYYYSPARVYIL